MLVERIWSGNSLRNFHYLIACPQTGEALAVDPLEWRMCLTAAVRHGWEITQILNTHEHTDHTGGNAGLKAATEAQVLAHAGAAARIGGVDRGLARQRYWHGRHRACSISERKSLQPSSPPASIRSTACSGWGIRPKTLKRSLATPAIARIEPFGFASSLAWPAAST